SAARVLEFDAVRAWLGGFATSPLGKERIAALEPRRDAAWIVRQHQLTKELRVYLRAGGRFEFAGLTPPGESLELARLQGAALELEQIRALPVLADRAMQWRQIGLHPPVDLREGWPAVDELTRQLADLNPFIGYFKNKIHPDGTLDDHASPELARLRR